MFAKIVGLPHMSVVNYVEQIENWMKKIVPGKSFADVGGLWGTVGERVSMAAQHKPMSLTMIDRAPHGELWERFQSRLRELGIDDSSVKQIRSDVESADFAKTVGRYDVVYSSGLLYHTPDPMHFMGQLGEIVNEYLICGTIVLTDVIMDRLNWKHDFPCSVFVPALNDAQKKMLGDAYQFHDTSLAFGITHEERNWFCCNPNEFGVRHNACPFWWLHPPEAVEKMIELIHFDVLDRFNGWDDRVMFFICKRKTDASKGAARDFIEVGEAGIAVDDAMRRRRSLQPVS
jgi:hypothetical protein